MPDSASVASPKAIDVFAGAGGVTVGLRQAGFAVLAAVDNDPLAAATYRANNPRSHVWETDIRRLPAVKVLRQVGLKSGELDLLVGCPPCQSFSTVRTRNGRRRPRDPGKELIADYLRFVRVLRPKALMLENVP